MPQGVEYVRILPEIVLSLFGMAIMVLDPLVDERSSQKLLGFIALVGLGGGDCGHALPVAISRPGFLGHGQGGWLQHLLPLSGYRDYCGRHPQLLTSTCRCSRSGRGNITG